MKEKELHDHREEIENLKKILIEKDLRIADLLESNRLLSETISLFKLRQFGRKAEKIDPNQLVLFNEAEVTATQAEATDEPEDEGTPILVPAHTRRRGKRAPLPKILPRERIEHDLTSEEKKCSHHGCDLVKIGEDISEKLDIIPAKVIVKQHVRFKYACPHCEGNIKTAPLPPMILPKSNASEGLLAHLIVGKFEDHLPLYRQEKILNRIGMELDAGTTSRWMIDVAKTLSPLGNLMRDDILASAYVQCDETPVQVLKEKDRSAQSKSYMWVLNRVATSEARAIIYYQYEPSRAGSVVVNLLGDFKGVLQTDGYKGYNIVSRENSGVVHIACWAHVRRKFYEAFMAIPEKQRKKSRSVAGQGYELIRKLYAIEKECDGKKEDDTRAIRLLKTVPLLEEIRQWADKEIPGIPPKSLTGKALAYMDALWPKLTVFAQTGHLLPDNNLVENAIRPFALGKKNWLFACSPRGADASAMFYSLIETAKASGHNSFFYIRHLLREIPKAHELADFEKLLPYNLQPIVE
jgi:transposase